MAETDVQSLIFVCAVNTSVVNFRVGENGIKTVSKSISPSSLHFFSHTVGRMTDVLAADIQYVLVQTLDSRCTRRSTLAYTTNTISLFYDDEYPPFLGGI